MILHRIQDKERIIRLIKLNFDGYIADVLTAEYEKDLLLNLRVYQNRPTATVNLAYKSCIVGRLFSWELSKHGTIYWLGKANDYRYIPLKYHKSLINL